MSSYIQELKEQNELLDSLTKSITICKNRITELNRIKDNERSKMSITEKLEENGFKISEYTKINTDEFTIWWQNYFKCYDTIYKKDGKYFSYINKSDIIKDIKIINEFNGDINKLIFLRIQSIDYGSRKIYLFKYEEDGKEYFYDNKWIEYKKFAINQLTKELKRIGLKKEKNELTIIGKSYWGCLSDLKIKFLCNCEGRYYQYSEINLDMIIFDKNDLTLYKSSQFTQYSQIAWCFLNMMESK